jgi:hypothetical protein
MNGSAETATFSLLLSNNSRQMSGWGHHMQRNKLLPELLLFDIFNRCILKNSYKILVGKPEGKRSLGRSSRKWIDNIRIDLNENG